ncbi:MAG TPA: cobalamin biosynthesis protein CobD [Candidatus Merdivicinus intestinigallinarum]|nr:cobalamin biosynthesis protein CobD [Candidatus Merdivicinus intestinigallinarum]
MEILLMAVLGFGLDLILGDPHWLYHPVRLIGLGISGGEKLLRKIFPKTPKGELAAGAVLAVCIPLLSFAVPFLLLWLAGLVHPWLRIALGAIFCYQILATKSLRDESMRVSKELDKGDLQGARKYLSWIVGRDTERLEEPGIVKAAVETVAENASDGVIAPLFYMMIGGPALGFLYKGVNTLDSMVGYKNDKYLYFGRVSAKVDDVFNFIPAILSAWLMIAASAILPGFDAKNAARIYKRDHKNHASPNSARTESVCAGALRVQLAGDAYYFGKLVKKPTIGDDLRPIERADVRRANRLMYMTAVLALVVFGAVRLGVCLLVF